MELYVVEDDEDYCLLKIDIASKFLTESLVKIKKPRAELLKLAPDFKVALLKTASERFTTHLSILHHLAALPGSRLFHNDPLTINEINSWLEISYNQIGNTVHVIY